MVKIKVKNTCAGPTFSCIAGQVFEVTPQNAEALYAKVRHDTAVVVEEDVVEVKKKVEESIRSNEDTDVLHDESPRRRGRKRIDPPEEGGVL